MTDVFIAIPSGVSHHAMFSMSFASMVSAVRGLTVDLGIGFGPTAANRNFLCTQALQAKAGHILFIDTDMSFPSDMLGRLIKAAKDGDLDILGVNALQRHFPHGQTAVALAEGAVARGVIEMARLGAGVLLINMRVIRAMEPPWFYYEPMGDEPYISGEDYPFCDAAREAGFGLWMDSDLSKQIVHWGGDIGVRWAPQGYELIALSGQIYPPPSTPQIALPSRAA